MGCMCRPPADFMHAGCADRKHSKLCFCGRAFLFWTEEFMDKLQERAAAFRRLIDYKYIIKLDRKGKIIDFTLDF